MTDGHGRWWPPSRNDDDDDDLPAVDPPEPPTFSDEPAWTVSHETPPSTTEDKNPTAVIPLTGPVSQDDSAGNPGHIFRRLRPEELSPEQLFKFNFEYTLRLEVAEALAAMQARAEPEEHREGFYVWKMIFQQLALSAIAVLVVIVFWILFSSGSPEFVEVLVEVSGAFISALAVVWFSGRIYVDWKTTELFSNTGRTGWYRPRNRLFLLTEKMPSFGTSGILTSDPTRGFFASQLNLNCWQVTLDSAADEEKQAEEKQRRVMKKLKNLRWVRNGDKFVAKIIENQKYNSKR